MADGLPPGLGTTLGPLLREARAALSAAGLPEAALDARLIVESATGTGRTDAVLDPQRPVSAEQRAQVASMLARRTSGEPVHRILGRRDFHGVTLALSAETLEPRPDTEALVDLVLPVARAAVARHGECRILDLGTGTGAIALALLAAIPQARALATDISADALATAGRNADINGVSERFAARRSRWFEAVDERFHLVVSNPPYIPGKDIASLEREVRDYDPIAALDGGPDGLDAYREIAAGVSAHLEAGGHVAVEIGYDQAKDVTALFEAQGFRLADHANDLGGILRALIFCYGNN